MKKLLSALLVVGLAFTAMPAAAEEKLKVVASFSILGDMVRQVTGDLAEVTTIVGPDADAHVYTPSASDAKAVANADVIFVNGLGFETWSKTLIETSGTKGDVFVATEGVEPLKVDGETDPHAWNALTNGMIYIANIAKSLASADPENAATYQANAQAYSERLSALHSHALSEFKKLPADRRTVVTAHDAFGYLADAYGLTFLAPVGIDTEAEPSAKDLAALIDHIKEAGAGGLFVENITSPALVQQIERETGIKIGGRLYSDALSERGGPATSYETMFEHNLDVLVQALSAQS
ncbi:metal ABC transporter substrate-binding protein [Pelagibius sp.]|uniref:metal ABC transporter substrate-binding protein n=1 Tax=Pelagibius sp. TaxID=1931238 RepID=UPI00261507DD|nr:metal ABC transporter substrate-binding protein [Pelagibius sp.]